MSEGVDELGSFEERAAVKPAPAMMCALPAGYRRARLLVPHSSGHH